MLDLHTPAELRELGLKMQPRLASDLMLNYILILRQHLCEPLPQTSIGNDIQKRSGQEKILRLKQAQGVLTDGKSNNSALVSQY